MSPEQLSDDDVWPQPCEAPVQQLAVLSAAGRGTQHTSRHTAESPLRVRTDQRARVDVDAAVAQAGGPFTPPSQLEAAGTSLQSAMWQACLSPAEAQDICALLGLQSPTHSSAHEQRGGHGVAPEVRSLAFALFGFCSRPRLSRAFRKATLRRPDLFGCFASEQLLGSTCGFVRQ